MWNFLEVKPCVKWEIFSIVCWERTSGPDQLGRWITINTRETRGPEGGAAGWDQTLSAVPSFSCQKYHNNNTLQTLYINRSLLTASVKFLLDDSVYFWSIQYKFVVSKVFSSCCSQVENIPTNHFFLISGFESEIFSPSQLQSFICWLHFLQFVITSELSTSECSSLSS